MPGRSQKRYVADSERVLHPAETLARARPHLARMGITRIANLTGLDRIELPTVMVTRPNSRSVAVALGKGLSLEAAEASGVMEAIETWHAERIALPVRHASFDDLVRTAPVVDVGRLPKVTGGRFDPSRRMLWIEGRDLVARAPCWVPYEMVDADYTHPQHAGHGVFPRSTNGLASGNDLLEATCHALCELVERDATTLWHLEPGRGRLDLDSIDDARCRDVLARFAAAGMEVGVWETTSDIAVPCFHAVIAEAERRPGHIGIGDGCHPNRAIALLRALTEAAQTRLTYISGARDDLGPEEFTPAAIEAKAAYARGLLAGAGASRRFPDVPSFAAPSFEEDLEAILGRLRAAGIAQAVAVDLTLAEIGIPVIRAVIPGLEAPHDDADYVPGPRARRVAEGKA